jgi:putative DNA primase/helicase
MSFDRESMLEAPPQLGKSAPTPPPPNLDSGISTAPAYAVMHAAMRSLRSAVEGERNDHLNKAAYSLGQLIGGGELSERLARDELTKAALEVGLTNRETAATIRSGLEAGKQAPRSDVLPFTDAGNAERLVAMHRSRLRYCHQLGKWFIWNGRRWRPDGDGGVIRLAKHTLRSLNLQAVNLTDDELRRRTLLHLVRSESVARIHAMVSLAQSEAGIPVRPDQLDTNPWLLVVRNGTIDLRTGELKQSLPDDLCTKRVNLRYDPSAKCPQWKAFLDQVLGGNQDLIAFLQRAIGYSLTGDVSEHVAFFLYGTGRNGKSTLLELILFLLGDYGCRTPSQTLVNRRESTIPNDVARLKGVRFVTAVETEEGDRLAEAQLKTLTGGDTISARFMRQEWFDFLPEFKLWLATNHRPSVRGTDEAIWDRIRLIPFTVRIPEAEVDRELGNRLKDEAEGILAWAVQGCIEWRNRGLDAPMAVRQATARYRAEMDTLGTFIDERCMIGPELRAPTGPLFDAYLEWCIDSGESPITITPFTKALRERGFVSKRQARERGWLGLALRGSGSGVTHDGQ